ncbi:MAG TPA: alpha/beta hydrolase [Bryobacteraceae bacterium]|nr:alpha/beta hydrolase [Bryobacteraceae bacterium]
MKRVVAVLLFAAAAALAQQHPVVPLWSGPAPGAQGTAPEDIPALTIYKASAPNAARSAVIVFPGGGYVHLAFDYEGTDVAEWLNQHGVSAFVLRYRLGPKYHYPVELWDAQRAIRYVRAHAQDFDIAPNHIGIWGFSAGGHLASTAGTHFDAGDPSANDPVERQNSRPDFMILAYPVITMEDPYVHLGSLHALLGEKPNPELVRSLSNETQVNPNTPPCFLFHTSDDKVVPVQNSIQFYSALINAGVSAEIHIYLHGRHGVGLAPKDPVLKTWPEHVADWLKVEGFL